MNVIRGQDWLWKLDHRRYYRSWIFLNSARTLSPEHSVFTCLFTTYKYFIIKISVNLVRNWASPTDLSLSFHKQLMGINRIFTITKKFIIPATSAEILFFILYLFSVFPQDLFQYQINWSENSTDENCKEFITRRESNPSVPVARNWRISAYENGLRETERS